MPLIIPHRIHRVGSLRVYEHEGTKLIVLPGHRVPYRYLLPHNWAQGREVGNTRPVSRVTSLRNGAKVDLYLKDPERMFYDSPKIYGGTYFRARASDKRFAVKGSKPVEQQVDWEARMLVGINRYVRLSYKGRGGEWKRMLHVAERPLAILIHPSGDKQLVTLGVAGTPGKRLLNGGGESAFKLIQWAQRIERRARNENFQPVDFGWRPGTQDNDRLSNIILSQEGLPMVIDVSRWEMLEDGLADFMPNWKTNRYYGRFVRHQNALKEAVLQERRRLKGK